MDALHRDAGEAALSPTVFVGQSACLVGVLHRDGRTVSARPAMDDFTWTHVAGDQSPTADSKGSDVEQGGLADCYFISTG